MTYLKVSGAKLPQLHPLFHGNVAPKHWTCDPIQHICWVEDVVHTVQKGYPVIQSSCPLVQWLDTTQNECTFAGAKLPQLHPLFHGNVAPKHWTCDPIQHICWVEDVVHTVQKGYPVIQSSCPLVQWLDTTQNECTFGGLNCWTITICFVICIYSFSVDTYHASLMMS